MCFLLNLLPAGILFLRSEDIRLSVCHFCNLFVGEHVFLNGIRLFLKVHPRRNLLIHRKQEGIRNVARYFGFQCGKIVFRGYAGFQKLCLKGLDAVQLLPGFNFFSGAVGVLVRRRMSAVTVCHHVEKHRAFSALYKRQLPVISVHHCERIHSVDALCMHLVYRNSRSETGDIVVRHCFPVGTTAHGVSVIHNVEQDRQVSFEAFFPQCGILIHCREVHRFIDRSAADGAVPDVAHYNAVFFVDFLV